MPTFHAPTRQQAKETLTAEYHAHLASPEWQETREAVLLRNGWACEWCMERLATQVHHLTYARFGKEWTHDLLALCAPCHQRADSLRRRFNHWARGKHGWFWHYRRPLELWWAFLEAIGEEA